MLPGVVKVFTFRNTPWKRFNCYWTVPGQDMAPEDETLFASKARFVGDRIAAVVAKDRKTAIRVLRLIRVQYEALPCIVAPRDASDISSPAIHGTGNRMQRFEYKTGQEVEAAPGDRTVETTAQKRTGCAMRPLSHTDVWPIIGGKAHDLRDLPGSFRNRNRRGGSVENRL